MKYPAYPAYKDSGVPWLGDIPAHWEVKRLKYTVDGCQNGLWGDEPTGNEDDIICIRVADFDRTRSRVHDADFTVRSIPASQRQGREIQPGDLLLEKSGGGELQPVGKVVLYDLPYLAVSSNFVARMRPLEKHDARFLTYLHDAAYRGHLNVLSIKQNTGIQNLDSSSYLREQAGFPPLPEQRSIAAFLDRETTRLDALIAKKERLIELLQEKRTALISHAVTKGLDPNVPMKDSGVEWLGQVPQHWEVMQLKHGAAKRTGSVKTGPFGSQLLADEMKDGEIKVYNQRNVIDRDAKSGDNYISQLKYEELRSFTVAPGNILVTTRGTIGRCFVLPEDTEPGILHPCLMRIETDHQVLLPEYLATLIQDSDLVQSQIFLMSNATTIDVIYSVTMRRVVIPCPPLPEQRAIAAYLDRETAEIDALIAKVRQAIEKLQEYRTALVSAAVTGKIMIRDEI